MRNVSGHNNSFKHIEQNIRKSKLTILRLGISDELIRNMQLQISVLKCELQNSHKRNNISLVTKKLKHT